MVLPTPPGGSGGGAGSRFLPGAGGVQPGSGRTGGGTGDPWLDAAIAEGTRVVTSGGQIARVPPVGDPTFYSFPGQGQQEAQVIERPDGSLVQVLPGGRFIQIAGPNQRGPSSSYSVSQSYSDPRALELDALRIAADIDASLRLDARENVRLGLLHDQLRVEEAAGMRDSALRTGQLMETRRSNMAAEANNRAQLYQQAMALQQQARQFNASQRFAAADANAQRSLQAAMAESSNALALADADERFRQFNQTEYRLLAQQKAEFLREPGDVAAAFGILQGAGPGGISAAIGRGENAITDFGLQPLADTLSAEDRLAAAMSPSERFFAMGGKLRPDFERVSAQEIAIPGLPSSGPAMMMPPPSGPELTPRQIAAGVDPSTGMFADPRNVSQAAFNLALQQSGDPLLADQVSRQVFLADLQGRDGTAAPLFAQQQAAAQLWETPLGQVHGGPPLDDLQKQSRTSDPLERMAHGGVAHGAFVAGDPQGDGKPNPETIIPLGNGMTLIMPHKGPGASKARKAGKGAPRYATGGLFAGFGQQRDEGATNRARELVRQATEFGLLRTGFRELPAPIFFSAPGTTGFEREVGTGLISTGSGFSRSAVLEEILGLEPASVPLGIARRTR